MPGKTIEGFGVMITFDFEKIDIKKVFIYGNYLAGEFGKILEKKEFEISKLPVDKPLMLKYFLSYLKIISENKNNEIFIEELCNDELLKKTKKEYVYNLFDDNNVNLIKLAIIHLADFQNDDLVRKVFPLDKMKSKFINGDEEYKNNFLHYIDNCEKERLAYMNMIETI